MSKKHMFIMLACCLIPIVALGAIFLFKIPVSLVGFGVIMLICPLSHILMMKFMVHDHQPQNTPDLSHHPVIDVDPK
jgi:hypothetical protein